MEFSPEMEAGLAALALVPGLNAIAGVAALAYSLLGDEPEPRLKLPSPFAPGSFLWGVPRRRSGPKTELGAVVTYRVEGQSAGGVMAAGQAGSKRVVLVRTADALVAENLVGGAARGVVLGDALAGSPPWDLDQVTLEQAIWSEILRRGAPESMAGSWLWLREPRFSGSPAPGAKSTLASTLGLASTAAPGGVAVEILDVRLLDGWWSPWLRKFGHKITPELEAELAHAGVRRARTSSPEFDDLDTRTWTQAYPDAWQTAAATLGEDDAGTLGSWRSPRAGSAAAEARELFEMRRVQVLAAWQERAAAWQDWRHMLEAEVARRLHVDEIQAAYDHAWGVAVSQGQSFEQAAAFALGALQELKRAPEALTAAGASPASGAGVPRELVAVAGAAALVLLVAVLR